VLGDRLIDDYPDVTARTAPVKLAGFKLDDFPRTRKLRITRNDNDQVITVNFALSKLESEDTSVHKIDDDGQPARWHVPAWDMSVEFTKSGSDLCAARITHAGDVMDRVL